MIKGISPGLMVKVLSILFVWAQNDSVYLTSSNAPFRSVALSP